MGQSRKPEIAYRFEDQARYLEAWVRGLALDGAVLIGHDWGEALALDWAARHPAASGESAAGTSQLPGT